MPGKHSRKSKSAASANSLTDDIAATKKALTAARRAGDSAAIAAAESALSTAHQELAALHTSRFEAIARAKGNTAARALADLALLCEQRRYKITQLHMDAILAAVDAAREQLVQALTAATRRPIEAQARPIVFDRKEPAHVS